MISWNRAAIWALDTLALMLLPQLISGIQIKSWLAALLFALLLGFVNAVLKPVLLILTLPISVMTLGLFALVVNALAFWGVAGLIEGIVVPTFWSAFWGALLYSVLSTLVGLAVGERR